MSSMKHHSFSNENYATAYKSHAAAGKASGEGLSSQHRQPLLEVGQWFQSSRRRLATSTRTGESGETKIRRQGFILPLSHERADREVRDGLNDVDPDEDPDASFERWVDLGEELLQLTEEDDEQTRSFLVPILKRSALASRSARLATAPISFKSATLAAPKPKRSVRSSIEILDNIAQDFRKQYLQRRKAPPFVVHKDQLPEQPVIFSGRILAPKPRHPRRIDIDALEAKAQETASGIESDRPALDTCEAFVSESADLPATPKTCALSVLYAPKPVGITRMIHVQAIESAAGKSHSFGVKSASASVRSSLDQGLGCDESLSKVTRVYVPPKAIKALGGNIGHSAAEVGYVGSIKTESNFSGIRPSSEGFSGSSEPKPLYRQQWSQTNAGRGSQGSNPNARRSLPNAHQKEREHYDIKEIGNSSNADISIYSHRLSQPLHTFNTATGARMKDRPTDIDLEGALPTEKGNEERSLKRKLATRIKRAITF